MRIKVFEQVKNTYTMESIGRRGNDFQLSINGWAYILKRGIYEYAGKFPGWTVQSNGRAYDFDCDYDGCFVRLKLADLSYRFRQLIWNLAKRDGYR